MHDEQQRRSGSQAYRPPDPLTVPNFAFDARLQRQALIGQALTAHTLRPTSLQRQEVAPVFTALSLQRSATEGLAVQRQALSAQLQALQTVLQPGAVQVALQRQAAAQDSVPALTQPPARPTEWVQAARLEVQRVADPARQGQTRWMGNAERARHVGTLRSVGQGLAQGFRADRGPAVQRYAEYGESLATLQRQPLTAGLPRLVLSQVSPAERLPLQRAVDEAVQRQEALEAKDRSALTLHALQRQLDALDQEAQLPITARIQARQGGGAPLPAAVQRQLEHGLNSDLSRVRVHTDSEADTLAKGVNAVAFTSGQDIYFRSGTFDPNTRSGLELLAHEVTHTVQQAQGKVRPGIDADAGLEQEARATGAKLAATPAPPDRSRSAPPRTSPTGAPAAGPSLQRATPAGATVQGPPAASDQTYVASFKRHLQWAALKVLGDNELRMVRQRQRFAQPSPSEPAWGELRQQAAVQARLEARWVQLTAQLKSLAGLAGTQTFNQVETMIAATQGGHGRLSDSANLILGDLMNARSGGIYTPMGAGGVQQVQQTQTWYAQHARPLAQIFGQIANLDDARDLLHAQFPALGVLSGKLGAATLAKLPNTAANNARLGAQVQPEFARVTQAIHSMRGRVTAGDLPWKDMDLLVEQVKGELKVSEARRKTDPQSRAVLNWMEQQRRTDFWVGVATAVGLLGLTVASFFVPGSTLLLVADLAVGGTMAAKSVLDAQKQLAVSKTQALGGQAVSSVTAEQAQQRLVMAQVEALMAAAPVVATAGGLLRIGRATTVAATQAGEVAQAERAGQTATQAGRTARGTQTGPAATRAGVPGSVRTAGSVNVGGVGGAAASGGRIRTPIAGLYSSIDMAHPPPGWAFRNDLDVSSQTGVQRLTTYVSGPGGTSGSFVRVYDASTETLKMDVAFLENLPKWVDGAGTPMVAGKGIPTVTYMTMYQMKQMKIGFGALKQVRMSSIQNFDTVLELERLRRAGVPLDKAILQTHSVQYAETSIIQSGHQIAKARVATSSAVTVEVESYMSFYEGSNPGLKAVHDALLKKYGFKRSDKMLIDFDIELDLKPLAPGQVARPLGVK